MPRLDASKTSGASGGSQYRSHPATNYQDPRTWVKPPATTTTRTGQVVNSGGGGMGGGDFNGGGGGGVNIPEPAPTPPPPPPMSITDWLAKDTAYQSQQSAFRKALADYTSQMGKQKSQYETDYARRRDELATNRTRSMEDQKGDFAGRGMLFSGVYGQDVSKLTNDFARREGDMSVAKTNWLDDLSTNFANYRDQHDLTLTKAKQDAINRRAAEYGLKA